MTVDQVGHFQLSKSIARPFVLVAVCLVLGTAAVVGVMQYWQTTIESISREGERLTFTAQQASLNLTETTKNGVRSLLMLAGTPPIEGIAQARAPEINPYYRQTSETIWKDRLGQIFLSLAESNPDFLQIRLIEQSGREMVRVNSSNGIAYRVAEDELQDKSRSDYVIETLNNTPGFIKIFGPNLNWENDHIEIPYQPVMRITTPVEAKSGHFSGIIVINVDMKRILYRLSRIVQPQQTLMLVNETGQYLMHPEEGKAFQFDLGKIERIQQDYPEFEYVFERVKMGIDEQQWSFENDERISHLMKVYYTPHNADHFFIVAVVTPMSSLLAHNRQMRNQIILITAALALIGAVIAVIASHILIRPLHGLTLTAQRLAKGEPANKIRIPAKYRENEIGILMRSVYDMASSLQEQKAHISSIMQTASNPIISINQRGIISAANDATSRLLGYSQKEMIGKNVSMLMNDYDRSHHDGYLKRHAKGAKPKVIGIGREVEAVAKDGTCIPIHLAVSKIEMKGRTYYTGILTDLTELKKVDKLKSDFVSTVSHELRTPLTSIKGALGILQMSLMGDVPESGRKLLDIASKNSDRLIRLINDILDIEKIEAGKIDYEFKPINVASLLSQVVDAHRSYAHLKDITFDLEPIDHDLMILADGGRMEQVIANLLSNAAKFSPSKGTVVVSAVQKDRDVQISVRDFGPGIPKDFRQKIFSKFAQADSSDTRAQGGTGLGLSISNAIVRQHGGTITFETEEGEGTTFIITMGLHDEDATPADAPLQHDDMTDGHVSQKLIA